MERLALGLILLQDGYKSDYNGCDHHRTRPSDHPCHL